MKLCTKNVKRSMKAVVQQMKSLSRKIKIAPKRYNNQKRKDKHNKSKYIGCSQSSVSMEIYS